MLAAESAKSIDTAGGRATFIDLADYPAAVYNGDNEEAVDLLETMRALKAAFNAHDALLIAIPEYNRSIPLSW